MKQFIKDKTVTYNLMSFTGYKALLLFSLLTEGPKSYEEVADYFYNHPHLKERISIDTMRVYMNSLKLIGCEIKRTRDENKVSRYQITEHPFELKLTQEQLQSVAKIYKSISKTMNVEEILAMENFFEKIIKYTKDETLTEVITPVCILKGIDKKLLEELLDCCKKKEQIVISYKSPKSGDKPIELLTDKIDISNGKIYLYGNASEYEQYGSFLVERINSIKEIKIEKTIPEKFTQINVVYELQCEPDKLVLESNEKLISKNSDKAVIEITDSNEFRIRQRLLEFGSRCKILEPDDFKNKFINLLKDMKAGYYCE